MVQSSEGLQEVEPSWDDGIVSPSADVCTKECNVLVARREAVVNNMQESRAPPELHISFATTVCSGSAGCHHVLFNVIYSTILLSAGAVFLTRWMRYTAGRNFAR